MKLFDIHSIRFRVALFMLSTVAITVFLIWIWVYNYITSVLTEQVIRDNGSALQKLASSIESDVDFIKSYSDKITFDIRLQRLLSNYHKSVGFKRYSAINEIEKILAGYKILHSEKIYDIYIFDDTYKAQVALQDYYGNIFNNDWYKEMIAEPSKYTFSRPHALETSRSSSKNVIAISCGRLITNLESPDAVLGRLVIDMQVNSLFESLRAKSGDLLRYIVIDETGNVIYPIGEANITLPDTDELLNLLPTNDADSYFIPIPINNLNLTLLGVLPRTLVSDATAQINNLILLIFAVCLLIAFALVLVLTHYLTRPIITLTNSINQAASGNLNAQAPAVGVTELSLISNSFNATLAKIRTLISEIESANRKEKDAQMHYFLSQINPHFIYNTLNCVIYLARKQRSDDIINLTKSFIHILRRNITIGHALVVLSDEIDYLNNYINVLKFRYNNMISISFNVEETLAGIYILPMILYPIVENCVYHGIAPKNSPGTITVEVTDGGNCINFSISDDGVGISKTETARILGRLAKSYTESVENVTERANHIGLPNVQSRMRLFYGENCALLIDSAEGEYTRVSFSIPKNPAL